MHDLVLILSLAMSHVPEKEESLLGRGGEEEDEDGEAEGFFFARAPNSTHLFCPIYSPKL